MKNLGKMMKQAQEMQSRMGEMQAELENKEVTGQSGGGLVQVTLNGKGDMKALNIDSSLCTADDKEVMEDLIVAAFNEARAQVEKQSQDEMAKLTGGLQLPEGFKLPF